MLASSIGLLVRASFFLVGAFSLAALCGFSGLRFARQLLMTTGSLGGLASTLDRHADDEDDGGHRHQRHDQQQAPPHSGDGVLGYRLHLLFLSLRGSIFSPRASRASALRGNGGYRSVRG
jgi:hypothetical protein